MEHASEELIRAALHDLANTLSGIQGILDLSDPARPLSIRDRDRLAAVLSEGHVTLTRARSLAMEALPAEGREPGLDWVAKLQEQLAPLGVLFRSRTEVFCGSPEMPGPRLRGFAHAMARLLLPYAAEDGLKITGEAGKDGWVLCFEPAAALPEALEPSGAKPRDIAGRWARRLGESLEARYEVGGEVLRVTGRF
jgi:hypothetical protein